MTDNYKQRIDTLIDKLNQAYNSEENQKRLNTIGPKAVFGMEEPTPWTKIFNYDANDYYTDPKLYFENQLKQKLWRWENIPSDQQPLTLDMPAWLGWYSEYTYAGMDVQFDPDGTPNIQTDHPMTKKADMSLLKDVDFYNSGFMPRALKWYKDLCDISAGRIRIDFGMKWWRGGLDLAMQLRGFENFLMDCYSNKSFIHELMEWLTDQRCKWHTQYCKHYDLEKEPANIGDDWVNIPFITPDIFREFVLPAYKKIEEFHGKVIYFHSCGNKTPLIDDFLELKTLDTFEVSPWDDLDTNLENIPEDKILQISIHSNDVLCTTEEKIKEQLTSIVRRCGNRQFNLNTSGLTPLDDDLENFKRSITTWTDIARKVFEPVQSVKK